MGSVTDLLPVAPTSTGVIVEERDEQQRWAVRIQAACQKSVEAILETGRLLIEAKAALPHGAFDAMVRDQLPFSIRTAQMLMAVAAHPVIANANHGSLLPPSWRTLYELTRWSPEELALGLKDSAFINPGVRREEVPSLRKRIRSKLGFSVRWQSKGRAAREERNVRRLEAVKRMCRKLDAGQRAELMSWLTEVTK